jgi:hypothetical protein
MAKRIGVDQSRISRIEQGGGKPKDYPTAAAYALEYHLSQQEAHEWFRLLGIGYYDPTAEEELVDYCHNTLLRVSQADIGGNAPLSVAIGHDLTTLLENKLTKHPFSPPVRQELLKTLGLALEVSRGVQAGFCFPKEAAIPIKQHTLAQVHPIADELHDPLFGLLYEVSCGRLYYIRGHYGTAASSLAGALPVLKTEIDHVPSAYLVPLLNSTRLHALSLANLGERTALEEIEDEIRDVLGNVPPTHTERVCHTLEGLARAQGIVKLPKAFDTLEETRKILVEMETAGTKAPVRLMQLQKTTLIALQQLEPANKRLLEKVGIEALHLTQVYGYERYGQDIKNLLDDVL